MTPTPAPLKTVSEYDGRHHAIPILASWERDESSPYHPLIAQVLHGRGHADKATAIATAQRMVKAYNAHDQLVRVLVQTIYSNSHSPFPGLVTAPSSRSDRAWVSRNRAVRPPMASCPSILFLILSAIVLPLNRPHEAVEISHFLPLASWNEIPAPDALIQSHRGPCP